MGKNKQTNKKRWQTKEIVKRLLLNSDNNNNRKTEKKINSNANDPEWNEMKWMLSVVDVQICKLFFLFLSFCYESIETKEKNHRK